MLSGQLLVLASCAWVCTRSRGCREMAGRARARAQGPQAWRAFLGLGLSHWVAEQRGGCEGPQQGPSWSACAG